MGTVVLLAAATANTIQVNVSGNESELRISSFAGVSNAQQERPPLMLLFDKQHDEKWDAKLEDEMLGKAAAAISSWGPDQNTANLIHSALTEDLPEDRDQVADLKTLGVKLG